MKRLNRAFEIETEDTVFSGGQHRKVIVMFAPDRLLGFRLKGTSQVYYLTAGACYDVAVKTNGRTDKRADLKELLKANGKAKSSTMPLLPFEQ